MLSRCRHSEAVSQRFGSVWENSVAHAYDERRGRGLTGLEFLGRRVIRLLSLYLAASALAAVAPAAAVFVQHGGSLRRRPYISTHAHQGIYSRCPDADTGSKAWPCAQDFQRTRLPDNLNQYPRDNQCPEGHSQKNGKYDPARGTEYASVRLTGFGNCRRCWRKCPRRVICRGVQSDRTRVKDTVLVRKRRPLCRSVARSEGGIRLLRRLEFTVRVE